VLRVSGPPADADIDPAPASLVIRDTGVTEDVDVLVLRRDAAGVAALRDAVAAVVVVVDHGLAPIRAVRAAAGNRRVVSVPWSARVARAAIVERVPAGLPGAWLRALAPALGGRPW